MTSIVNLNFDDLTTRSSSHRDSLQNFDVKCQRVVFVVNKMDFEPPSDQ